MTERRAGVVARALRCAASDPSDDLIAGVAGRAGDDARVEDVLRDLERELLARDALAVPAAAEAAAEALTARGAHVVVVGDAAYPEALRLLWPRRGAAPWLFVDRGRTDPSEGLLPSGPAVAVVGTRHPSLDGVRTAGELAAFLVAHGVVVVSGLARGIDQAAHREAVAAGGATVAVLGCGFGVDYPGGSGALRAAIATAGGLVTTYVPGARVRPHRFLARNWIISGLADVVVVVEARERSGALATAFRAVEQGRDVLAVPGSLHQPTAEGPLRLLREGTATVLTAFDDVLDRIPSWRWDAPPDRPSAAGAPASPGTARLPPVATAVLGALSAVPATVGALATALDRPVSDVLVAVEALIAAGLATRTPAGVVRR